MLGLRRETEEKPRASHRKGLLKKMKQAMSKGRRSQLEQAPRGQSWKIIPSDKVTRYSILL